jgi:hypothetical protein
MAFNDTWLPNILCTSAGSSSLAPLGLWQRGRSARIQDRHARLLTSLLQEAALTGGIELEVGPDGEITGGPVIRSQAAAVSSSHAVANLTAVPASPGTEPHE